MQETFLMCEPTYFGVDYVINPWMEGQINQVNQKIAQNQWNSFYSALKQYATVELIPPEPKLPDLVFTANAGLVKGQKVILAHFRHKERQPEEKFFKAWFEQYGYTVSETPSDIYFEGHGDAIFDCHHQLLWLGHGIRSDIKAKTFIEKMFSISVIPLELVDTRFYHLDTCFCPLLDDEVMYYPGAFSGKSRESIENNVPKEKRIAVTEKDAINFICNCVLVKTSKTPSKKGILFVNALSEALRKQLESLGYQIQLQPVSEFQKSGGANQCLTLKL